ncbi:class D beta-lactamase [Desulfobotulus sp. H1]|uniref:Beta-lactamase n=1 Tax=Desulfobotulus pelophilus TaxID=2823377 RepID=A0ABT3N8Q1_9BACT|nr:class D beta-lactamase [Desulfobotulus pelophilus]MCW7753407.1 class D beta-lactamase [Desulfobotulus pelophilus]
MSRILARILCLILSGSLYAHAEDTALAELFHGRNIAGTLVISSQDGETVYVHNNERARTPCLPASTFKVLHTLIAMEEGVVADEREMLPWDGKHRGPASWNRDQSMETAFALSCVWFFQRLAERMDPEIYADYLKKTGYGNAQAGPDVRSFWLDGDLRISAMEQIDFLKGFHARRYPFNMASYDLVERLMLVDQGETAIIRAKTGWVQKGQPEIGWYVGYVETSDNVWFFAMNMDIHQPGESRFRQIITMEALTSKGILADASMQ